jgi:hypothetical protein
VTYVFKDLGNGQVETAVSSKMTPAITVPLWMIEAAFPGAGANVIRRIVKLAKNNQHNGSNSVLDILSERLRGYRREPEGRKPWARW